VETLEARGEGLAIGLQVLAEAWVVATRPPENNGFGWPVAAARTALQAAQERFALLLDDPTTAQRWLDLVTQSAVLGKRAHDARLAALMASHGITHVLTINVQDFTGFPGATAVHPRTLITEEGAPSRA
jgi:predicted nucleic acid-binding protein